MYWVSTIVLVSIVMLLIVIILLTYIAVNSVSVPCCQREASPTMKYHLNMRAPESTDIR